MKTVYREKRYYCGEYLDVYIYPTYRQGRSRGKRSKRHPPLKRNSISGIERKSSSASSTRTLRRTTSKSI